MIPSYRELQPIREGIDDWSALEDKIVELFQKEIYLPLLEIMSVSSKVLKNSSDPLVDAIEAGRIHFDRGLFSGKFNASISRELRRIGAKWDRKTSGFKLPAGKLPPDVKRAIGISESRFKKVLKLVDKKLSDMFPDKIADKLNATQIFDTQLWKVDTSFKATIRNITVAPDLTPAAREKIAAEYNQNMKLYIKDWTEKEIIGLRAKIQENNFSGLRYEGMIKTLQDSYGVSYNKAKFLARQETKLLTSKFKEARYTDAGINEYKWQCVVGSPNHPVRPMHKRLDGKICRFDDPPIVDEKGNRKNPGEDYGCRCVARPIVRF